MNNSITTALEELRILVAANNNEKDNVLLDLCDSLTEAMSLLAQENLKLKEMLVKEQNLEI